MREKRESERERVISVQVTKSIRSFHFHNFMKNEMRRRRRSIWRELSFQLSLRFLPTLCHPTRSSKVEQHRRSPYQEHSIHSFPFLLFFFFFRSIYLSLVVFLFSHHVIHSFFPPFLLLFTLLSSIDILSLSSSLPFSLSLPFSSFRSLYMNGSGCPGEEVIVR